MSGPISWLTISHAQELGGAAVASVTMGALAWKNSGGLRLWIKGIFNAGASRRQMHAKIDTILKEVHPNGGSSLRDSVDAIKIDVSTVKFRQSRLSARVLAVMEENSTPMWEADTNGNWTWANAAYLHVVDRSLAEIIGYGWVNSIHWDDRDRVQIQWMKAIAEHRNFEEQYRIVTPTGTVKPISCVAKPFLPDGEIAAWIAHSSVMDAARPAVS